MQPLVLASASPRRRELLARLGLDFVVRPAGTDEDAGASTNPEIVARRIAREKAEAARLLDEESVIIAADTVVAFAGELLAKPENAEDARRMLRTLRGHTHEVVTAVAVMPAGKRTAIIRHPVTRVTMRDYSDDEIELSVHRGDPFDKAGGYAIQDEVLRPVAAYRGCYCNVIGLPLIPTVDCLRKAGVEVSATHQDLLPQCRTCPFPLP